MKLTLKPTSAYPVPTTFHSHSIKPPTFPSSLRTPLVYVNAQKSLKDVGLSLPSALAVDKTLWWQFAVQEVEWNLEQEEIVVIFTDGTDERWDFLECKSEETVDDVEMEEGGTQGDDRSEGERRSGESSKYSPKTILARLHELSIELRSAYEDITGASLLSPEAPRIETEQHYATLMALSANPSLSVPFEWTRSRSLLGYYMDEGFEEETEDISVDSPPKKRPSQPDSEDQPRQGVFKSRRRPTRLPSTYENSATPPQDNVRPTRPPRYDYLSLVALLTTIRSYLADLFSLSIVPALKEIVPPTYPLWAADGGVSWCRRQAIEKSAMAAEMILDLIDEEGEGETPPKMEMDIDIESDGSSGMEEDGGEEDGWGIVINEGRGRKGESSSAWSGFVRHQRRRDDNPLSSMKEDLKLKCWAEDAIVREEHVQKAEWLKKKVQPRWFKKPLPWDVSLSIEEDESELDEPPTKKAKRGVQKSVFSPFAIPRTLTPQPPTSPPQDPLDLLSSPSPRLPHLKASSGSTSSSSDDEETASEPTSDIDEEDDGDSTIYSDFFYPEDPLGEEFLPKKLPKAVITPSTSRGKGMEQARAKLHATLNEIAGLQKRIKELQEFAANAQVDWETARADEREEKSSRFRSASGLRTPRPSPTSPPRSPRASKILPIKAQPLLHQRGDRSLSSKLEKALNALGATSKVGKKDAVDPKPVAAASPKPRKRQKDNLKALARVDALMLQVRQDGGARDRQTKRKRESPTTLAEKMARVNGASGVAQTGPNKKARKGKPMKREDSKVDVSEPARSGGSNSSDRSDPSKTPSATRLSLHALASQRRSISVPTTLPPSLGLTSNDFTSLPEHDIVVDPEPSFRFSQLSDDGEETDEEDDLATVPVSIHLRDETKQDASVNDDLVQNKPFNDLTKSPVATNSSATPLQHPLPSPAPISTFPVSSLRDDYSNIDPSLSLTERFDTSSDLIVPPLRPRSTPRPSFPSSTSTALSPKSMVASFEERLAAMRGVSSEDTVTFEAGSKRREVDTKPERAVTLE